MDEGDRQKLAERIHGYSSMPGIPREIQDDLIAASVLIYSESRREDTHQEETVRPEKELKFEDYSRIADSQPTSLKYLGPDGFDYLGFAKDLAKSQESIIKGSSGIDPDLRSL